MQRSFLVNKDASTRNLGETIVHQSTLLAKDLCPRSRDSRLPRVGSLGIGALSLDVTGLLALVADLFSGRRTLGAVAREVAGLATVVALGAVDTVT